MQGFERRKKVIELLENSEKPISGSQIAKLLGVSRQIIVQDIALLRAEKYEIMATARGYILYKDLNIKKKRVIAVKHDKNQTREELETVVDLGGTVLDVIIDHDIYGELKANLMIECREDINEFLDKLMENHALPLSLLTSGTHYHTIEANKKETLDKIEQELRRKGFIA